MKRHKEAPLQTLDQKSPVLMHTCCAPCSGDIINTVKNAGISFTLFFYNPNTNFCTNDRCIFIKDNVPVFKDGAGHLTKEAAITVVNNFLNFAKENISKKFPD